MPQSTRRWISEKVKSLQESEVLPFHEILDARMVHAALAAERVSFKDRVYTPLVTLCVFLSQVLDPDHSCRAAVARLIVWLAINGRKPCAPDTGSYCEARRRLPLGVVVRLVRGTAQEIEAAAADEWLWRDRRVLLVDGTTASMPDTAENQRVFPQSKSQGIGLGFPLVRIVALIALCTGVVRDLALGPYAGKETGETALFRTLMDDIEAATIVLGDRYFASYFGIAALIRRSVDGVFRMHQRRKVDFRRGCRIAVEDHIVVWTRPARPRWMDEATYAAMPEELRVRELRVRITQPGFRDDELVLVTTMTDGEVYSKEELAGLYLERWNMELDLRSIKCVLQMDVLRCKTPDMVEKEMWMHILAYNLIRGVMARAAKEHDVRPRQTSFKGALQTMTAFQESLQRADPRSRRVLVEVMLEAIASHRVADRFGRVEPRANKRRPKPQRYLTEPRREARKRLLENK